MYASPRVYHQLRTPFLSFLGPTLIPAALFSRSRSYIALLFLFRSPSFPACCPWSRESRPRSRAPGINRAAAPLVYACLCMQGAPAGFHPEMQSYLQRNKFDTLLVRTLQAGELCNLRLAGSILR